MSEKEESWTKLLETLFAVTVSGWFLLLPPTKECEDARTRLYTFVLTFYIDGPKTPVTEFVKNRAQDSRCIPSESLQFK